MSLFYEQVWYLIFYICQGTRWFNYDIKWRINSFNSDLSQIFIIVIEISLWPWGLCMFKTLIFLRISSSLKSEEHILIHVRKLDSFYMGWFYMGWFLSKTWFILFLSKKAIENICFFLNINYKPVFYQKMWN